MNGRGKGPQREVPWGAQGQRSGKRLRLASGSGRLGWRPCGSTEIPVDCVCPALFAQCALPPGLPPLLAVRAAQLAAHLVPGLLRYRHNLAMQHLCIRGVFGHPSFLPHHIVKSVEHACSQGVCHQQGGSLVICRRHAQNDVLGGPVGAWRHALGVSTGSMSAAPVTRHAPSLPAFDPAASNTPSQSQGLLFASPPLPVGGPSNQACQAGPKAPRSDHRPCCHCQGRALAHVRPLASARGSG